jgi:hypothetical protein
VRSGDRSARCNAGSSHLFRFGKLPAIMPGGGYSDVIMPDMQATWQPRAQVQFMFPKLART